MTSSSQPYYAVCFNGAQPLDTNLANVGSPNIVGGSPISGFALYGAFGAASQGISALTAPKAAVASNVAASAGLQYCRVYSSGQSALMDIPVSLVGGGGGMILSTLTSIVSTAMSINAFSIKVPTSHGATLKINTAMANKMAEALTGVSSTAIEIGKSTGGACTWVLYSGAPPATADLAATGSVLATFTMNTTNVFQTAVAGSAALTGSLTPVTASGTGTVGYCRISKTLGGATCVIQGTAGISGTDFLVNTVDLVAATTSVTITDATVSF